MSELVKRLREYRIGCGIHCSDYNAREPLEECLEAADLITALEAENKALREGLAFYANPNNYVVKGNPLTMDFAIFEDCGDRARALLAEKEKTS